MFINQFIIQLPFVRRNTHMTSLEITNIIPVLRRPRNINHRPRKIRIYRTVASDSDDGLNESISDRSSPISLSDSNEISSNGSSSDEADMGSYKQKANKIQNNKGVTKFSCQNSASNRKKHSSEVKILGFVPSLFLDDFEHTFQDENLYDSVFLPSHEDNHHHVIADDWHDVLSFFCNNEEKES